VDSVAEASQGGAEGDLVTTRAVGAEVVKRHSVVPLGIDRGVLVVRALRKEKRSFQVFSKVETRKTLQC
jgi:hypothetical protein